MAHHDKVDCLVKRVDCLDVVQVKVTERVKNSNECYLDDISLAAEPSVTKLGMVMQHRGPNYHARRLVCCLQVQGHSEGSFNQT